MAKLLLLLEQMVDPSSRLRVVRMILCCNGQGTQKCKNASLFPPCRAFDDLMLLIGDSWTPPPDAWRPDETPAEVPDTSSSMSGFDVGGGGFSETAAEAVAAAPDAGTVMNAALSAADLGNYPSHIAMKLIEYVCVCV